MIHLDTSFLIRAMMPGSSADGQVRRWLSDGVRIGMSAIAWAEFLCGPLEPAHRALASRIVPHIEPFLPEDSLLAAELFNGSGRRRGSFADCLIAAGTIRTQATLATANLPDFRRFESGGLKIFHP